MPPFVPTAVREDREPPAVRRPLLRCLPPRVPRAAQETRGKVHLHGVHLRQVTPQLCSPPQPVAGLLTWKKVLLCSSSGLLAPTAGPVFALLPLHPVIAAWGCQGHIGGM